MPFDIILIEGIDRQLELQILVQRRLAGDVIVVGLAAGLDVPVLTPRWRLVALDVLRLGDRQHLEALLRFQSGANRLRDGGQLSGETL